MIQTNFINFLKYAGLSKGRGRAKPIFCWKNIAGKRSDILTRLFLNQVDYDLC